METAAAPSEEEQAFTDYSAHGVEKGTPLTRAEFADFWRVIPPDNRVFWIERFRNGPTELSREFIDNIGTVTLDEAFLSRMRERLHEP